MKRIVNFAEDLRVKTDITKIKNLAFFSAGKHITKIVVLNFNPHMEVVFIFLHAYPLGPFFGIQTRTRYSDLQSVLRLRPQEYPLKYLNHKPPDAVRTIAVEAR